MANRVAPSTAVPTINKFVDVISKGVSKNSALLSLSLMILGGIGRTRYICGVLIENPVFKIHIFF
jgi:hypothetical protein